eukprot:5990983-Pyramimonas_sp.AAC.1
MVLGAPRDLAPTVCLLSGGIWRSSPGNLSCESLRTNRPRRLGTPSRHPRRASTLCKLARRLERPLRP